MRLTLKFYKHGETAPYLTQNREFSDGLLVTCLAVYDRSSDWHVSLPTIDSKGWDYFTIEQDEQPDLRARLRALEAERDRLNEEVQLLQTFAGVPEVKASPSPYDLSSMHRELQRKGKK